MQKKYTNYWKETLSPKRLVWLEGPTPEQLTAEENAIKENLSTKEIPVGDAEAKARGKINAISTEIKNLYDKVQPLGIGIFERFKAFLKDKTGVELTDLSETAANAEQIQTRVIQSVEQGISTLRQNNNEKLRELDAGLDKIMARVQMRKELATALEPLGEKVMIGTSFEEKMRALEPNLNSPTDLSSFRKQLELTHEFSKFAKMLNTARTMEPKALSLETAQMMPELGIAYTRPDGRHNYYKYWVEVRNDSPVVYAIDRAKGRIQKFDPKSADVGEDAWVFADEPGGEYAEYQSPQYRNRDGTPNQRLRALMPGDIDAADPRMQNMLNNQRAERAFIDAETRNYVPTEQEKRIPAEFARKFNASEQNSGNRLSEMLRYLRSDEHRNLVTSIGQPAQPEQRTAPEQVEQNLDQVQLRLKADENREVELKEGVYEMNTGKIEADRTLLTFDQPGEAVSMTIDDKNFPKMRLRPEQPEFNLYREYFEVTNNQINFKRNHAGKANIILDVGNEITIPVILKKGTEEVPQEIKIKIHQKPPEETSGTPSPSANEGQNEQLPSLPQEPSTAEPQSTDVDTRSDAEKTAEREAEEIRVGLEAAAERARVNAERIVNSSIPQPEVEPLSGDIASPGSSSIADVNSR